MNKKLIMALLATTLFIPTTSANANPTWLAYFVETPKPTVSKNTESIQNKNLSNPTIAILDGALDISIPMIKDRLIYEACVTQWSTCPNSMSETEGPGSSTIKPEWLAKNGFDHGTQMAALAIATNPNINIVFVRVVGTNPTLGLRQATGEATVYNALDWVIRNKDKFNIQAVSMSQGHSNLRNPDPNYCPKTPITEGKIETLAAAGVPVFFPTGNSRNYTRIDWPACIPASIAVGATMPAETIAIYSNYDPLLTDFFALGTTRATSVGGKVVNVAGTSASTVIAATQWATIKAAKPNLTYTEIYDLISRTAKPTFNSKIPSGKLIDLQKALNG